MLLSSGSGKKLNGMKKGTNKMEILFFAFVVLALVRKISDLVWERELVKKKLGESNYNYLLKRGEK